MRRLARTCAISTRSASTSGRSSSIRTSSACRTSAELDRGDGGVHDVADRMRLAAQRQRPCLEPRHVEQVGDEPRQMIALVLDRLEQDAAVLGGDRRDLAAQRRDRRLDRRERRAQVVRHRADERAAPAVDLLEQLGPQRLGPRAGCARSRAPPGSRTCRAAGARSGRGRRLRPPAGRPGAARAVSAMRLTCVGAPTSVSAWVDPAAPSAAARSSSVSVATRRRGDRAAARRQGAGWPPTSSGTCRAPS